MTDDESQRQEREWREHEAASLVRRRCPYSGLTLTGCEASICDCFNSYAYTKTDGAA